MSEKHFGIYWLNLYNLLTNKYNWKSSKELKKVINMSVLTFQCEQCLCILPLSKFNEWFMDQICIIWRPGKNFRVKSVANGLERSFCQCKNQKYLQIWLLLRLPITSEKCINYRALKKTKKQLRVKRKLSVDAIILKTSISTLRSWINFIQNFYFFVSFI